MLLAIWPLTTDSHDSKPSVELATFSRPTPTYGTGWTRRCATSSRATTITRSARRSSRTRSCSRAAWAKRPTSFPKRCSRGKTRPARQSEKAQSLTLRPGEHGRRGARLHRARTRQEGHAAKAVLHWAAVSSRASAEGTLSPVLPDRRGDHRAAERGQRVSVARCGSAGDAGDAAR